MAKLPTLEMATDRSDRLVASGSWQIDHLGTLTEHLSGIRRSAEAIDATDIERLDSAGALVLARFADRSGIASDRITFSDAHRALFQAVVEADSELESAPERDPAWQRFLEGVGRGMTGFGGSLMMLLGFLGLVMVTAFRSLLRPSQWRVTSTVHHMQQTGLNALPLVCLLSFLVGAVVAFLGATVLRDFGAELFVVDLTTYAFLREFGVLLTAILLAGRTASAFTAQLGTMKSREEIDAIRTLGLDPIVLLVLPRLLALLVVLPILAVCAMFAGLAGGLTVGVLSLDIPFELFTSRVAETVQLRHYLVGLVKAPLFAVVIALVGCLEGFKVAGTAQSVGERTTSAVVQSISLVIVINALAAVFFMEIGW